MSRTRRNHKNKSHRRKVGKRKSYRKRSSRRIRGGNPTGSATAYGEAVYGSVGQQHVDPVTHTIAQNYVRNV